MATLNINLKVSLYISLNSVAVSQDASPVVFTSHPRNEPGLHGQVVNKSRTIYFLSLRQANVVTVFNNKLCVYFVMFKTKLNSLSIIIIPLHQINNHALDGSRSHHRCTLAIAYPANRHRRTSSCASFMGIPMTFKCYFPMTRARSDSVIKCQKLQT